MKIEGYVLEILKKLEEKGYEAYIAKDAVILHCLEKPIEEYEIITSAPLFFLYEGKAESNRLTIERFSKKIRIYFETSIEEFKHHCSFQIELLFYHPQHGILGSYIALQDMEAKILRTWKQLEEIALCKALYYKYGLGFLFEKRIEEQFLSDENEKLSLKQFLPCLQSFFTLDEPTLIFQSYFNFFKKYFELGQWIFVIDYLKTDFMLRISLFLLYQAKAEKWIEAIHLDSLAKLRITEFISYWNTCEKVSYKDLYEKNIAELWFAIKRAMSLAKQDFQHLQELDQQYKDYLGFIKAYHPPQISIEEVESIGFTKQEAVKVYSFLKKEIHLHNIENNREALLTKANKIYKEKWDLDIFF